MRSSSFGKDGCCSKVFNSKVKPNWKYLVSKCVKCSESVGMQVPDPVQCACNLIKQETLAYE